MSANQKSYTGLSSKQRGIKTLFLSHPWDLTLKEAIALQKQLAGKVIRKSGIDIGEVATVAGVDTHYHQGLAIAAAVVIRLSDLATVDHATAVGKIRFPYISGLLTFREGPAILAALDHLTAVPSIGCRRPPAGRIDWRGAGGWVDWPATSRNNPTWVSWKQQVTSTT
jgi:hypothetical protein